MEYFLHVNSDSHSFSSGKTKTTMWDSFMHVHKTTWNAVKPMNSPALDCHQLTCVPASQVWDPVGLCRLSVSVCLLSWGKQKNGLQHGMFCLKNKEAAVPEHGFYAGQPVSITWFVSVSSTVKKQTWGLTTFLLKESCRDTRSKHICVLLFE